MKTILFQGDSISDASRDRAVTEPNIGLGEGYVSVIAEEFQKEGIPVNIYNRGVSGNRIGDMYARWIEDTLNIDHDILNVLNVGPDPFGRIPVVASDLLRRAAELYR